MLGHDKGPAQTEYLRRAFFYNEISIPRLIYRSARRRSCMCPGSHICGSACMSCPAASPASRSVGRSRPRSARWSSGSPCCRNPNTSPAPRSRKSSSAIQKPSSESVSTFIRCLVSACCASVLRIQKDSAAPRPTRPRS